MNRPPTIRDVAQRLGIHKSTVSLALSGRGNVSADTRTRVQAAARELGYEPNPLAQRLAYSQRNSAVVIVSGLLDVGLATEKALLIQQEMTALQYDVPIYTCAGPTGTAGQSQAAQIRQVCRQRPQAIICAAPRLEPDVFEELAAYQKSGGVVVGYDLPIPLNCDQVVFDREDNAYRAARHLLEHGHRRIGLGMSDTAPWASGGTRFPQEHRLRGFERALDEFGVVARPEWLFRNRTYEPGGAEMARQFLRMGERPTGLCIVNDYVALAFMAEIMRAGVRVPEEVSIVGHDDQPVAAYCPAPLTSVSHPAREIAHAVVELLRSRLGGSQEPPQTVTLTGQLVSRESVDAPQENSIV